MKKYIYDWEVKPYQHSRSCLHVLFLFLPSPVMVTTILTFNITDLFCLFPQFMQIDSHYILHCVWLLLINIMFMRFIHIRVLSLFILSNTVFHCVTILLLIHSTVAEHLDHLHFEAIRKTAAIHKLICHLLYIHRHFC